MMRVALLGEMTLELDGTQLEPPASRRARALLGLLALDRRMHPRGQLAARFWPDVLDESARTSLRSALSALRRALGADAERYLLATRDEVGTRRRLVGVDGPGRVRRAESRRGGSRKRSSSAAASCSQASTRTGCMSGATSIAIAVAGVLARHGRGRRARRGHGPRDRLHPPAGGARSALPRTPSAS